jgi:hypothetical protein
MSERIKRPRDVNERAKLIVDVVTGDKELPESQKSDKDPHASELGKKGGRARAKSLTPAQRKLIAKKAAEARWVVNLKKN